MNASIVVYIALFGAGLGGAFAFMPASSWWMWATLYAWIALCVFMQNLAASGPRGRRMRLRLAWFMWPCRGERIERMEAGVKNDLLDEVAKYRALERSVADVLSNIKDQEERVKALRCKVAGICKSGDGARRQRNCP